METKINNTEIIEAIRNNNGEAINDHNVGGVIKPYALVETAEGDICPVFKDVLCCLNPVVIQGDGLPHLLTGSVGANYEPQGITIEEAVDNYNNAGFYCAKIVAYEIV